jgi:uncharacterized protein
MIREMVVVTVTPEGRPHVAPMGVTETVDGWLLQPFRPSTTLTNLELGGALTINAVDDVRVFAGCITGRRQWHCTPAGDGAFRLTDAATHWRVRIARREDDAVRPRFFLEITGCESHRPFAGFNRAQAAVVEAAILASRLDRLPPEKIIAELDWLRIAIDKTAGAAEQEAWEWLMTLIHEHPAITARPIA